jgi:hypothetical protein
VGLRRPSWLVSRRVNKGRFGDPGMLAVCMPGSVWNRLLGLQLTSLDVAGAAFEASVVAAVLFEDASSVPSSSPSPFLSRASNS